MGIYIRQICLVAQELGSVVDALRYVFALNTAYVDEEVSHFGLENTLLGVGTQFIEVVAPIQDDTAAGRYLERQGGDGGYMVIGQVLSKDAQNACRNRAAQRGVRVAFERNQADWQLMQLHPRDMQAAFFEVDWEAPADPQGHWSPAGGTGWEETVSTTAVEAITGATLESSDPDQLAALWGDVAGVAVAHEAATPSITLENFTLRFVRGLVRRSPRLLGVTLKVKDHAGIIARAQAQKLEQTESGVRIGGVWFDLEP